MTMVAVFHMQGFPVILGDLLVSGLAGDRAPTLRPPAVGPDQSLLSRDKAHEAKTLRQKVNIIAPNCAFAFAGREAHIIECIQELRALARRPLTRDGVHQFIGRLPSKNWEISLVGCVVEGSDLALLSDKNAVALAPLGSIASCCTAKMAKIHLSR